MQKPTIDDLQSPDSKILFQLIQELQSDINQIQKDISVIANDFGFVRGEDNQLIKHWRQKVG